jgi:hypothetical protein
LYFVQFVGVYVLSPTVTKKVVRCLCAFFRAPLQLLIKATLGIQKYLTHDFDFIIDFRFRTKLFQELIISRLIYNAKTIFTVHSF